MISGYMEIARGHHGCGLMYYTIVPQFSAGTPNTVPLPGPPGNNLDHRWPRVNSFICIAPCLILARAKRSFSVFLTTHLQMSAGTSGALTSAGTIWLIASTTSNGAPSLVGPANA